MGSPSPADVILVLRVTGELDLHTQPDFEETVRDHLSRGSLVLDLADLQFLAICALRSLLVSRQRALQDGRELVLARCPAPVRRLLATAELGGALEVYDTIDEAADRIVARAASPAGDGRSAEGPSSACPSGARPVRLVDV